MLAKTCSSVNDTCHMQKIPLDAFSDKHPPPKSPARGLATLRPRDTHGALAKSGAYSRTVGFFRLFLPILAALVLLLLLVWPMIGEKKMAQIVADNIPNLVIDNLHFTGLDGKNQPYSLTAARALQAPDTKNVIVLEKPQGDIELQGGAWLAGKAQEGRFDQSTKNLLLEGNVHVYHDLGYQFSTSEARVDLGQNTAWGDKPVVVQGSFGVINGQGFNVLDKGNTVVIKGPAKARLSLQAPPHSDKTETDNKAVPPKGRP
jgi:lipopolysaccharide export system protein LptC